MLNIYFFFFFQAEDGIRDYKVTGVQTCALPIYRHREEATMHRLEGKTALITGAARGIGAQIARRFAQEGARVIVNDLELEVARKTAAELDGHAIAADVSDSAAVGAMFLEVRKVTPRLDILVNNAGISGLEGRNDAR